MNTFISCAFCSQDCVNLHTEQQSVYELNLGLIREDIRTGRLCWVKIRAQQEKQLSFSCSSSVQKSLFLCVFLYILACFYLYPRESSLYTNDCLLLIHTADMRRRVCLFSLCVMPGTLHQQLHSKSIRKH